VLAKNVYLVSIGKAWLSELISDRSLASLPSLAVIEILAVKSPTLIAKSVGSCRRVETLSGVFKARSRPENQKRTSKVIGQSQVLV